MGDGTVEKHPFHFAVSVGLGIGQMACQSQFGIRIVYTKSTRKAVLPVFAIDGDVLIRVAL